MDSELLKSTYMQLTKNNEHFAEVFYDRLFKMYPDVQSLFSVTRIDEQYKMFSQSIAVVVRKVDDHEFLKTYLQSLGKRHQLYGVVEEHYDILGQVLMYTLKDVLADHWSKEVEDVWREAYALIKRDMLSGCE
jgi:hemoglobin-like flavoprotein